MFYAAGKLFADCHEAGSIAVNFYATVWLNVAASIVKRLF
jgi:hypothetical protein